jgi:hypothetical protein
MSCQMRFLRNQRSAVPLWGVGSIAVLVIVSFSNYDNLPSLLSREQVAYHYKELERDAATGRPFWPSLDSDAKMKIVQSGWKDDSARRAAEVRARLDEEAPLPSAHHVSAICATPSRTFHTQMKISANLHDQSFLQFMHCIYYLNLQLTTMLGMQAGLARSTRSSTQLQL